MKPNDREGVDLDNDPAWCQDCASQGRHVANDAESCEHLRDRYPGRLTLGEPARGQGKFFGVFRENLALLLKWGPANILESKGDEDEGEPSSSLDEGRGVDPVEGMLRRFSSLFSDILPVAGAESDTRRSSPTLVQEDPEHSENCQSWRVAALEREPPMDGGESR